MKKLFLIRHAKSDWSNPFLNDFDRPLNKRGKNDALLMGEILKSKKIKADLVISSPALRAKNTAKVIAKKTNYKNAIFYDESIYESSLIELENIIYSIENKFNIVFLVTHNPSLNILCSKIIDFYDNIPTCGIIEINFKLNDWSLFSKKNIEFLSFYCPKQYK